MKCGSRRSALLLSSALAGLVLVGLGGTSYAADQTYQFDIPAESLGQALTDFSRASSQQIVFSEDLTAGKSTKGLHGRYTATEALAGLLAGTGLSVEPNSSGVTMVRSKNVQAASNEAAPSRVETVVVTGTSIRGLTNPTEPITSFDRSDISRGAYTTTQDFLRSLPQNFGGGTAGASEDGTLGPGANVAANNEAATGANLRGLGNASTLTLLNGHRMAASAFGGVTDISGIPLAALDRVDVLTDGASAIYGSDAVGGVVNFVLRQDYDGAETRASFGGVTDGMLQQAIVSQTLGRDWSTGNVLASAQYPGQSHLPVQDRSFSNSALTPTDLLPTYSKWSGLLAGHQDIAPNLQLFADAMIAHSDVVRSTTLAHSSLQAVDHNDGTNIHAGVAYDPFSDWRIEISGNFSRELNDVYDPVITPQPSGYTLGALAGTQTNSVASGDLKADGTIFATDAGDAKLAIGGTFRAEDFQAVIPYQPTTSVTRVRGFHRHVEAGYAELFLPLVGPDNVLPLVQKLAISAAVRYDHYSDFGGTTNPKLGLAWSPIDELAVRASWGTSFRAPDANELINVVSGQSVFLYPFSNPSGAGTVPIFLLSGVNPNLEPEKATTWNAGFSYQPKFIPDAVVSLDYYDIDYRDRIETPPFNTTALLAPATYGSLITSFPNAAAASSYLANLLSAGFLLKNPFSLNQALVQYAYDDRTINAAIVHQTGLDLDASYTFSVGASRFDLRASAAVINEITTSFSPGAAPANLLNIFGNPISFRMRDDVLWSYGPWHVDGALNYADAYRDTMACTRFE